MDSRRFRRAVTIFWMAFEGPLSFEQHKMEMENYILEWSSFEVMRVSINMIFLAHNEPF